MTDLALRKSPTLHGHSNPEPIGLECVAAALDSAGFSSCIESDIALSIETPLTKSRVVLFSAITSEYPKVFAAAKEAKLRGDTTVIGGYHASGSPQEVASQSVFDYVVVGEGDEIAVALAKALSDDSVAGLDKFRPRRCGHSTILHAPRVMDLDSLPFPLRSEERLGNYLLYDLMWPPMSQQKNTAIVLASRGCVHNCDFCASASVWGCGVTFRSPENILRELRGLKSRFGTNMIVIIDQSFGQNREWTLDLCRKIKEARLGINWYHQSNLTLQREVIQAMAEAGCTKIGFGLEGLSPQAVEMVKPPNPTDFAAINDLFDYCTSLGLFVKAYTMIGFPWETEETIQEYLKWIARLRATQVKISYMTPFPGTVYWEKYHKQLLTRNWEDFDTVRMPVVRNPCISVEQYHQIRRDLFRAFYGSDSYADVTKQMIAAFPRTVESYREFVEYLRTYEMIKGDEAWLAWIRPAQTAKGSVGTKD